MTNLILTRRELARCALGGAAGALLLAVPSAAQVVDPAAGIPPVPPTLPTLPLPASLPSTEGRLLLLLLPLLTGYPLTETQSRETALQLQDYPGDFAQVRAFPLPEDIGPAFAADAPVRKERSQ